MRPLESRIVLAMMAHPDDAEFLCAGSLARLAALVGVARFQELRKRTVWGTPCVAFRAERNATQGVPYRNTS